MKISKSKADLDLMFCDFFFLGDRILGVRSYNRKQTPSLVVTEELGSRYLDMIIIISYPGVIN